MKRFIKVRTPGSCGELIQGFYGQQEMLISYPINIYSEVVITRNGMVKNALGRKGKHAVDLFFQVTQMEREAFSPYCISVENNIPVGKGMASSTADISGILRALYHLYELPVTDEEIARICCQVEPTDSTIFSGLTLFDHINGQLIERFDWMIDCDVLVLEPEYQINTTDFRQAKKEQLMRKNHHSGALSLFKEAAVEKSIEKLCEATYLSAIENQEILEKPFLKEIYETARNHGCYGVNVAHSGSVVAVLLDSKKVSIEALLIALGEINCLSYYKKQYMTKVISGGSEIMED